jgi:hypothetical protein
MAKPAASSADRVIRLPEDKASMAWELLFCCVSKFLCALMDAMFVFIRKLI